MPASRQPLPDGSHCEVDKRISGVTEASKNTGYQDSEFYQLLTKGFGLKLKAGEEFESDTIIGSPLQVKITIQRKKVKGKPKQYPKVVGYAAPLPEGRAPLNVTVVPDRCRDDA